MQTFFGRWLLLALALLLGWALPAAKVATGPQPSATPSRMDLQPVPLSSFAGGALRSGHVSCRALESAALPTGDVTSGQWACEGAGSFATAPVADEYLYVLAGSAQATVRGQVLQLKAGDALSLRAGDAVVWALAERLQVSYLRHDPGRLVRWYRALTG